VHTGCFITWGTAVGWRAIDDVAIVRGRTPCPWRSLLPRPFRRGRWPRPWRPCPRRANGWRLDLPPLPLVSDPELVVVVMLCGCRGLYPVARWGRERLEDDLEALVALPLPPGSGADRGAGSDGDDNDGVAQDTETSENRDA
jgi:hypothetical protein